MNEDKTMLLDAARSQLLLVDMQARLMPAMEAGEAAVANARLLLEAARQLGLPLTVSEQYPQGLGLTIPELPVPPGSVLPKTVFACHDDAALAARMDGLGRPQLVVFGVEAHVCVLQSALVAQAQGYSVRVVADACASRRGISKTLALDRMARVGVQVITAEMAVFEWLRDAASPAFRSLSRLIRDGA